VKQQLPQVVVVVAEYFIFSNTLAGVADPPVTTLRFAADVAFHHVDHPAEAHQSS
jgi:hypothetical protein